MFRRVLASGLGAALLMLPVTAPAMAQSIELFTTFPGIVVDPGTTASFDLQASGPAGAQAALSVEGVPEDWSASFRSAGSTVDRVAIGAEGVTGDLRLDLTVPATAAEGTVELVIRAGPARLPVSVTVQAGVTGSVTLTPDFPGLRGPVDGNFTFSVTVDNQTAADADLELEGSGPEGWTVSAEPSGQAQASVITVPSGTTATVNLSATPPPGAEAGLYEVGMTATGEGVDAELTVAVELIGDLSVAITTPDQRLNAEVTAGDATELAIVVVNDGTAPVNGLSLTAQAPAEWEVTLEPQAVDTLAPGGTAQVVATITPSSGALAGDYDLSFTVSADTVTDSMSIRTTVNPSPLWGIVGVALIALSLAGLALVFRKYGRR